MIEGFGPVWANRLCDTLIGDAPSFIRPATVYVALFNAPGTEVSGSSYSRVPIANSNAQWGSASAGKKSNLEEITFAPASAEDWGLIDGAGLYDASSGGNLMAFGPFPAFLVGQGDTVFFAPGAFVVGMRIAF